MNRRARNYGQVWAVFGGNTGVFKQKENTGHPGANQCFPEGRKLIIIIVKGAEKT